MSHNATEGQLYSINATKDAGHIAMNGFNTSNYAGHSYRIRAATTAAGANLSS